MVQQQEEALLVPDWLTSRLLLARVFHQRLSPRRHGFLNRLFYFALDLDRLDALNRLWPLVSSDGRPALYQFQQQDHLPGYAAGTLRDRLQAVFKAHGVCLADTARVLLITHLRVLGYGFNPVSFYIAISAEGVPLGAVAEVGNTFGEQKPYFLPYTQSQNTHTQTPFWFEATHDKAFYISPFSSLDHQLRFRVPLPADPFTISITEWSAPPESQPTLVSWLRVDQSKPLTQLNLIGLTLRFPIVTLGVIVAIHWQAFRLWQKKVPFFFKEQFPERQQGVLNPHRSLKTKAG